MKRKLAVILASDVAHYSSLVAADEEDTVRRFTAIANQFKEVVSKHSGRIFNTAGDAILAEFDSAVNAVRAAVDVHEATSTANLGEGPDRRIEFRIGLAIGDVIVTENDDLLGDGVNIAARLQTLASPGGTCISEDVYKHVASKLGLKFVDIGEKSLKNIPRPVRAYQIGDGPVAGEQTRIASFNTRWIVSAAIAATAAAAGLLFWRFGHQEATSEPPAARPFVAEQAPFISDLARAQLQSYVTAPKHKAIALSRTGMGEAVGAPNDEAAGDRALSECRNNSNNTPCELYALGDSLVWSKTELPMPLPVDVRSEGSDVKLSKETLPLMPSPLSERILASYLPAEESRALAIGNERAGWAFGIPSPQEATRRALERCADLTGAPCLLFALGDKLLQPLPRSRKIVGVFTFAGDATIPQADRDALMKVYSGRDWRAIAHGANGAWRAVANEASEEDAVRAVLSQCNANDKDCTVFAIGNFRIQ
jgi:class 3 adenylate cyclase